MKKLLLCGSLFLASTAFSQVLTEDFEGTGGALPAGWTTISSTPGSGDFVVGDAILANTGGYWPVPATSNFAQISDDNCNCDLSEVYLITPSMDFTGLTGVALTYDFVDDLTYGGNPHSVEVSTNGGGAWTNVWTYAPTTAIIDWQEALVPLGAATDGASNVRVRFKYDDGGGWATGLAIDNVVVNELPQNDLELTAVSIDRWALINTNTVLSAEVKNVGGNEITSLEIDWNDGTSHLQTVYVNIAPGASEIVAHPTNVTYATAVEESISVTITAVNGTTDSDPSNNTSSVFHNTLSEQTHKSVVIEEGAGTSHGWSPRGAVAMNYMTNTYPDDFIGIAVHNGDPMTFADYDNATGFSIFPKANIDRSFLDFSVSQSFYEEYYNVRVDMVAPANVGCIVTGAGTNVQIQASAIFYTPITAADFRLAVVISEDNVAGVGSGYDQTNFYSGGGQGPMGGYESLPDPVAAADMVYNHVGRALLGGYDGQPSSVPTTIADGTVASYTFNYIVPAMSNRDNMNAIVMLIDNNTGEILNAHKTSINEQFNSIEDASSINMNVYPNPANDNVNVAFEATGDYTITITDMAGRLVSTNAYSNLSGAQNIAIPVADLMSGNYIISVANSAASYNQVLVIR